MDSGADKKTSTRRMMPGAYEQDRQSGGKLEKGPNGRNLCRWCKTEVPKGRRTFCGDDCVHEWRVRTDPQYVRHKLRERDQGICCKCGIDTEALYPAIGQLKRDCCAIPRHDDYLRRRAYYHWRDSHTRKLFDAVIDGCGFRGWENRSLWEAHHKHAVAEGGGECGLDNFETICLRCHKAETAELRKRLAKGKQPAKQPVKSGPRSGSQTSLW